MAEIDKNKPYSIMNNFLYNSNQPLDAKYGPYPTLDDALKFLSVGEYNENLEEELTGLRYIGLTFGVLENGKITEYWFDKDINKPVLKYPIENTGGNGLPDGYYIASFDINNGSVNTKFNSIITDNEGYIELPEVSDLSNQRFLGWCSTPNGDVIQDYPKINNNIIYYGKWEKVQKITWYEGEGMGVIITVKVDGVNITNNSNVVVGSKVEVSKTDNNSHYPFKNWNITGVGINISSNDTTVTFDMPESDVEIRVIEGEDEHTVTINQNDKGDITYNGDTITFENGVYVETVNCRTDIKLNTEPKLGYSFKNWVINNETKTIQYDLSYRITDDTNISVNYYKQGILIKGAISTKSQLDTVLEDETKRDSINYDSTVIRTFVPYLNNNYNTSGYTFLIHENDELNINHFKDYFGSYNYGITTADINTIVIQNSGVISEDTRVLYKGIFDGTVGNNPIDEYTYNNITYSVYVYYCGNKFQEISYTITNN